MSGYPSSLSPTVKVPKLSMHLRYIMKFQTALCHSISSYTVWKLWKGSVVGLLTCLGGWGGDASTSFYDTFYWRDLRERGWSSRMITVGLNRELLNIPEC